MLGVISPLLGVIDTSAFSGAVADLVSSIGVMGPLLISIAIATIGIGLVIAWTRRASREAKKTG